VLRKPFIPDEEELFMNSRIEVFVSYVHEDTALLQALQKHLLLLVKQGLIDDWYDQDINAGAEWELEVRKHLDMASIILLLVSPDFIASDICSSTEIRRAIERHEHGKAFVIPIILRPVEWRGTAFGRLQALPTGGKPITTWSNRDLAFLDVVQGIRRVAETLTTRSSDILSTSTKSPTTTTSPISSASSKEIENIGGSSHGNKRLVDLENIVRDSYSFIRGYESILGLSDDPREKWQAQQSIDNQANVIKDFLGEYMELANQLGVSVPIDIIQISASLGGNGGAVPKKDYFAIRNALTNFSVRELRLLGLDLGIDIDMFPGEDMESKVLALLDYLKQRSRMDELVAYLQHKRPSLKFVS
jgi:TIR domain/Effector-associated domain 7